MNKADLIQEIAKEAGLTSAQADQALTSMIDTIKGALKKGEKVSLVGFGTWDVRKRKARNGVNPHTGAAIKIPAAKVPKFTAGKELRQLVE